jgi:hypothetical protein
MSANRQDQKAGRAAPVSASFWRKPRRTGGAPRFESELFA